MNLFFLSRSLHPSYLASLLPPSVVVWTLTLWTSWSQDFHLTEVERPLVGVEYQCDVTARDWPRAVQTDSGALTKRLTLVHTDVRQGQKGIERVFGHGDVKVSQAVT